MKSIIPLLILISLISCKKKDKQDPNNSSTPLTEQQQYELALNKIKNKKFKLNYLHNAFGIWHLDTTTNIISMVDSIASTTSGDTLNVLYEPAFSSYTFKLGSSNIFNSNTDTIFFNKIYLNSLNEKFVGLICYNKCQGGFHQWWAHATHDTSMSEVFMNYLNYNVPLSWHENWIRNEIQYYFDKDSIVFFNKNHSGGFPVEKDEYHSYKVMYGKAIN